MDTPIDTLYKDYIDMKSFLESAQEISLLSSYTNTFRKVLALSCGSDFECQITNLLTKYAHKCSAGDTRLENFIYNQAIKQRYHTLFAWGTQDDPSRPEKNANKFYRLFGTDFSDEIKAELTFETTRFGDKTVEINNAIQAFLELGHLRNILVHSNFAQYPYDQKTPEDIYALYKSATLFVKYIHKILLGEDF